ncbi:MAG: exo-alpha-sialidase [Planctomycetota bacterium]
MSDWMQRASRVMRSTFWVIVSWSQVFVLAAVADEPLLRPLSYNHPGLNVDLGVGLWAYPLPIDYDEDGDMDLLVGCPDKPSSGTYFFENATQDPAVKMPVFKPGVRVGPGYHYMMLSQVGGDAVVMRPGFEYRRDPMTRRFEFDHPKRVAAPTNPHDSLGRVRGDMWRYVDFDGDGDQDIAVGIGDWADLGWDHAYDHQGNWRNGPLHGFIYVVTNHGSDQVPEYDESPFRLRAGDGELDVYGWPCPNFADFDGDGDLDLLCGEFLDGFTYFSNIGTRDRPVYATGVELVAAGGFPLKMQLQMITPTAVDWDRDGDFDLVVGDEDGRVALIENTGRLDGASPVFRMPRYFQQEADELKFGALATPFTYDWDGDGDEDIICGNTAGSIGFFENMGIADNGLPKWNSPVLLRKKTDSGDVPFRVMAGANGSIQGPCEAKWGYTTLSVADWDGDGDGDIVYNSILARLGLLIHEHKASIDLGASRQSHVLVERRFDFGVSELPPRWNWDQVPSSETLTQWRTTPLVLDFDLDGQLDLVALDQEGFLTLRKRGRPASRIFVDEDERPLRLNAGTCGRSGRVKIAMVDWDGDSRMDLLVNSENATWYRNCATQGGHVVMKRVGNLARRNVAGHTSSPAVCDFDRDSKPDLLVGSENGRIYHIAHDDCVTYATVDTEWVPRERPSPTDARLVRDEEFLFKDGVFSHCSDPTLCETSRGLVAAWVGSKQRERHDQGIWGSYHDGQGWRGPVLIAGGGKEAPVERRYWNPLLLHPPGVSSTFLLFDVGGRDGPSWGASVVSYDRGRTFRNQQRLPPRPGGSVSGGPIFTGAHSLWCSVSESGRPSVTHLNWIENEDGKRTWTWGDRGEIFGDPLSSELRFDQATMLRHGDGRVQAVAQSLAGDILTSFSEDEGQTWSVWDSTRLPRSHPGIDAIALKDGRQLLIHHPQETESSGEKRGANLTLAIATDGVTWQHAGHLSIDTTVDRGEPAIVQSADGSVHALFTWNGTRIRHLVLDVQQD